MDSYLMPEAITLHISGPRAAWWRWIGLRANRAKWYQRGVRTISTQQWPLEDLNNLVIRRYLGIKSDAHNP